MERPDLDTLSCVNVECQLFGRPKPGHLTIRKRYGKDGLRLLRCRGCREAFSERRGTALFNTKVREAKATEIIDHLDEGCSVRSTARLTKGMLEGWPLPKKQSLDCLKLVVVMLSASMINRYMT